MKLMSTSLLVLSSTTNLPDYNYSTTFPVTIFPVLIRKLCIVCALVCFAPLALALELGFEGLVRVDASDNINAANAGLEQDGQVVFGQLGVYGEQSSRSLRGAFSGEIETRRRLNDPEDDELSTLTRFLGAADVSITPKSLSWYVGDILGTVRDDDAIQQIDGTATRRRNVFITGPTFEYDIDSFTRTRARLLYVNQSEDDVELESLYNASFSWENERVAGTLWGIRLSDIYTDNPQQQGDDDFNRVSASAFAQRQFGLLNIYAELGGTQYDAEDESLNGATAQLRVTRQFTPQSALSFTLSRDLRDETLNTIQSLLPAGDGVQPEVDGFFNETALQLNYDFQTNIAVLSTGVGIVDSDYRLLFNAADLADIDGNSEDQMQTFAFVSWSRSLTPRLRATIAARVEQQDYDNRSDKSDSILTSSDLTYQLTRSFRFEVGYQFNRAEGTRTRFVGDQPNEEIIDSTESRVTVSLRWLPPSRASRDLTIELRSLLQ